MVALAWRKILLAGVVGYGCGKLPSLYRTHTEAAQSIIMTSATAGAVGATLGWCVAAYRNIPSTTHIFALSLGANFTIAAGTFMVVRTVVLQSLADQTQGEGDSERLQRYSVSAASGGVTGLLLSAVAWRGVSPLLMSCGAGMVMGMGAQYLFFRAEKWKKKKALELHYPELVGKRGTNWSLAAVERRFLGFWHRHSKSAQVGAEIELLVEDIVSERQRVKELDQQLAGHGVVAEQTIDQSGGQIAPIRAL